MSLARDSLLATALHPSPNFGERRNGAVPSILLLHYTGVETAAKAIAWLAAPASQVSCHYVVDELGHVTQMVAEGKRAWHAGIGAWAGDTDVNSTSIGIEVQNVGHVGGYPPFPEAQIAAVIALCADIVRRHRIRPERVLAHSDIAPSRKIDPGEKFPWDKLAGAGVGRWVEPAPVHADDQGIGLGDASPVVAEAQAKLADYGYAIAPSGVFDRPTEFVVSAFQRHFRPARVDGRIDRSTVATLDALTAALRADAMIA